jgi:hypothetical protein
MLERLLPTNPATVLDVGGGADGQACWLAAQGYRVHLLDITALGPVHGPRVTAVQMRTRCNHLEPDLAAIRPKASTEGGVPDRSTLRLGVPPCARMPFL